MTYTVYRVLAGDTLTKIAGSFGLSLSELIEINPHIENADSIHVGEPLNVPIQTTSEIQFAENTPSWYAIAQQEMQAGVQEVPGSTHNPRIIDYHQTTELRATDDETSWCSSFVNWCMQQVGIEGTNSAAARSWLRWGVELDNPAEGCVVIIKRGNEPWMGHVGFFAGNIGNQILILGGNQGNEVNISSYTENRLLGFRWTS